MKTLKNFNHWISELREIAKNFKFFNGNNDSELTNKQYSELFNKQNFKQQFEEGQTPEEAFKNEIESLEGMQ